MTPEEKEKKRKEVEINDIRVVLKTPEGKRVLWRVLEKARIFNSIFSSSGGNRELTDFHCGRQDVGLWLFQEILTAEPEALTYMKRANDSREKMDEIDKKQEIEQKTVLIR